MYGWMDGWMDVCTSMYVLVYLSKLNLKKAISNFSKAATNKVSSGILPLYVSVRAVSVFFICCWVNATQTLQTYTFWNLNRKH